MFTFVWFVSVMALLVADVRTGALQQKDPVPHRCYSCVYNETASDVSSLSSVECPSDRPLCSTTSVGPNFTSTLNCAAVTKTGCSLTHTTDFGFQFTCVCMEDLCNGPFTADIQKKLISFMSSNFTDILSDYVDIFLNFANVTGDDVYKQITVSKVQKTKSSVLNASVFTTLASKTVSGHALSHAIAAIPPRAEALKQEATAPSDDDEDDSEGSGAYEENKLQRQPGSDPAAPSSFLPAHVNKASVLFSNFLVSTPILIYFIA